MQAGEWQETEDDDGSASLEDKDKEKKGHDSGDSNGKVNGTTNEKGDDKAEEEGGKGAGGGAVQDGKGSGGLTRAIRFKTPLHVSVVLSGI